MVKVMRISTSLLYWIAGRRMGEESPKTCWDAAPGLEG